MKNSGSQPHKILIYDGLCGLCNRWVRFVMARDKKGVFRFASLQGATAARLLSSLPKPLPDSLALVAEGKVFFKSEAVLRVAMELPAPWNWAVVLRLVPCLIRDFVYDRVAAVRYRLFGKYQSCPMPRPEWKDRFLD